MSHQPFSMVPSLPAFMEHRWGQRRLADLVVRLIGSPGAIGIGRLRDVSASGAFVQTKLDLPLLSVLRVELVAGRLPANHPCTGRAYVVRQDSAGVGIEWLALGSAADVSPGSTLATRELLPIARAMSHP
jgi:hypothetical protein